MSNIKYKYEKMSTLFDNKKGNGSYTKKYCNSRVGQYEVYTGSTLSKFALISTYDYSEPNLSYTTDGEYAGTLKVLTGLYNVGGHRALLIKKDQNIDLNYFQYILQPIFFKNVKRGDVPSINWKILQNIEVPIPIDKHGKYDLSAQKKLANDYEKIFSGKMNLQLKKEKILKTLINEDFSAKYNHKDFLLCKIVKPVRGNSKYTKTYCHNNPGIYPVYSANNNGPLAYSNFYDYDGTYLTISVNGIAGKVTTIKEKFSVNGDRIVLMPLEENIDLNFIKYTIEPILRSNSKGRMGHDGQNEFTKLSSEIMEKIKISIPIDDSGDFDLNAQKDIALKYQKIDEIKKSLAEKIDNLCPIGIKFED